MPQEVESAMKHDCKLTVVLLTYNRNSGGFLKESLEAVLGQTYSDFEFIVADNHSTDDTADFVLGYKDPRLTYIRQPPGGNASSSYLRSLWMARGNYVLFTHDDDVMEPEMIERQMSFLDKHPGLLCVGANVSLIDTTGRTIQPRLYELEKDLVFGEVKYITTYLEEKLWIPTPTLLWDRDAHLSTVRSLAKKKKPKYWSSGDIWALFMLNLRGPIGMIADPLLRYRQHPAQESRNVDQSSPLVQVSFGLCRYKGRDRIKLTPHMPAIQGAYARFKSQDILFRVAGSAPFHKVKKGLIALKEGWEKVVEPDRRAVDAVAPFEILIMLLGLDPTIPEKSFVELESAPAKGGAQMGYRRWLHAIYRGDTLFSGSPSIKRIVVFGSMLTSFLIIQDARRSGVEVICCLDSSPARIGENVWGIPVRPLHDLGKMEESIDAVVMSSERDHEDALRRILVSLAAGRNMEFVSWKDLALNACNRSMERRAKDGR
jgi:glycosyltransferase involved in cell wall biosynthesis